MKTHEATTGPKVVQLINGGTVSVEIESATYQNQVFIRLSPTLVLGLVNTTLRKNKRCDNIYLWQKVGKGKNAPYRYLGDITLFRSRETGSATVFGFALSKNLPQSLEAEALRRQKTLEGSIRACNQSGDIFNSLRAIDGLICCPTQP